jgi:hypothetical protein
MPLSPALRAAYEAAEYVVFDDSAAILRIGEPCPEMDALFEADGAARAAFVTAFNPNGLPRAEDENYAAFGRLCKVAEAAGCKLYLGQGMDPEGNWPPEPSLLLVGISRTAAEALGRSFGQLAIVFVEKGRAPELVVLD